MSSGVQGSPPTIDEALTSSARLLRDCELETDLAKVGAMKDVATAWIDLAGLMHDLRQGDT